MEHEDDVGVETIARCRALVGPEANALSDAEKDALVAFLESLSQQPRARRER